MKHPSGNSGAGYRAAEESPHRMWKFVAPILVALGFAVFMQFVEYWGWFAGTEGRALDFLITLKPPGKASAARVILVEIDDDAYVSCFGGVSPLNPQRLQQVVSDLTAKDIGPSVLGIDIITDAPEYRETYLQIAKDLLNLKHIDKLETKIVWAAGSDVSNARHASIWEWFWGTEAELLAQPTGVLGYDSWDLRTKGTSTPGPLAWGLPVFPADEDFRLRRFPRKISAIFLGEKNQSTVRPHLSTWAKTIAELYGGFKNNDDDREVMLSYSIPFVNDYHLTTLYNCPKNDGQINLTPLAGFTKLKDDVKGRPDKSGKIGEPAIILLGGTFSSSGDFHETSRGRLSGLEINGRAVQAELAGPFIHEFPKRWMLLFDTIIGSVIGLVFAERRVVWGSLVIVILGVLLIGYGLIAAPLWLSGVGAALWAIGCITWWLAHKGRRTRALIWGSLGMVILAVLVSYFALLAGYWWVSCVGVAIGVNLHVIYETYKMDRGAANAD